MISFLSCLNQFIWRLIFYFIVSGATDFPCFRGLLKQLVVPLSTQLSDRRSTIVKQVCYLVYNISNFAGVSFGNLLQLFACLLLCYPGFVKWVGYVPSYGSICTENPLEI